MGPQLVEKSSKVGNGANDVIDLLIQDGTADVDYVVAIVIRKDGSKQWYHNGLSEAHSVWVLERGKMAILRQGERDRGNIKA